MEFVRGQEISWRGAENRMGVVEADWGKRGHDYEPHRERHEHKSHTCSITSKHTHLQLMRMMESR